MYIVCNFTLTLLVLLSSFWTTDNYFPPRYVCLTLLITTDVFMYVLRLSLHLYGFTVCAVQ